MARTKNLASKRKVNADLKNSSMDIVYKKLKLELAAEAAEATSGETPTEVANLNELPPVKRDLVLEKSASLEQIIVAEAVEWKYHPCSFENEEESAKSRNVRNRVMSIWCKFCEKRLRINGAEEFEVHRKLHEEESGESIAAGPGDRVEPLGDSKEVVSYCQKSMDLVAHTVKKSPDLQEEAEQQSKASISKRLRSSKTKTGKQSPDVKNKAEPNKSKTARTPKKNSSQNVHECLVCYKRFQYPSGLHRHEIVHTGEKPFDCDICNRKFAHAHGLKNHKLTHTGEKHFTCQVCGKTFAQMGSLKSHSVIHTGHKAFECSFCKRKFSHRSSWRNHEMTHGAEERIDCPKCGTNVRKTHLPRHLRNHKNNAKRFKCLEADCNKTFSTKVALESHTIAHTGELKFQCSECNRRFSRRSSLYKHKATHTGDKPYECPDCDKKFAYRNSLKEHKVVHSGEKRYECEMCKKKFSQRSSLALHVKSHNGEKPFECIACEKTYIRRVDLERHAVSHLKRKPFQCSECSKSFTTAPSLKKHAKRIHETPKIRKLRKKKVTGTVRRKEDRRE